jgi:CheY-like chemotaxis protein
MSNRCVEILLVEDNPGDVRLVREALKEGRVANHLHVVIDGTQAITFLRREAPYEGAATPDLVLLDLNLPRMDGREVLAVVKGDRKLKRIPVVVLTTSDAEQDILRTYDLGCNCYITKPVDLEQFIEVIKLIDSFWLTVVTLPPKD